MIPLFDIDDPVLARAAWSRLAEPGDRDAIRLVQAVGPSSALRWVVSGRELAPPDRGERSAPLAARPAPVALAAGPDMGVRPGGRSGERPPEGAHMAVRAASPSGGDADSAVPASERARARWLTRLEGLDPRRELRVLAALGGRLLAPDGPGWPSGLADLGEAAPICLWARGAPEILDDLEASLRPAVAVVGSRAATAYGELVTAQIVADLVGHGVAVVSGGAFGIDAAAHRAALGAGGLTVAVMAGGVDRLYPAGNETLLEAVLAAGAVISEVAPGGAPRRERFLARNRLIAALGEVTVVTESGWRSGAHRTARDAAALLRPVAAVPGPVTAASSAGCHKLIREGVATLVTAADEVRELLAPLGTVSLTEPEVGAGPLDGLAPPERQVLDSLPKARSATLTAVVAASGLSTPEVMAALSRLERAGRVDEAGGLWRRRRMPAGPLQPRQRRHDLRRGQAASRHHRRQSSAPRLRQGVKNLPFRRRQP
ncbi:MAG: DNA-protecting protein DprA, partial [Bifidobacteriaceae bacterium]|nr:DNA-protecting protein DprA [Bifidobacteriaceae bacterium]